MCISYVGTLSEIAVSLTMTCFENYLPKIPALNLALEAAISVLSEKYQNLANHMHFWEPLK